MKGGPWVDMPLKRVFVSPLAGLWGDEPQSDADDITVVRHADFQRERFVADGPFPTVRSVPRHQSLPRMLAPDDILIEKSGFPGYPALYVPTRSEAAISSNFVARLRTVAGHHPRFCWYLLQHLYRSGVSRACSNATTFANLDFDALLALRIRMPPLEEQRRITTFLDVETERIRRLARGETNLREKLKERRSALAQGLVLRGLDPSARQHDSGLPTIGPVPAHWGVQQNKTLIREVEDFSTAGDEELLSVSHLTGVTPRAEKNVNMFMAESLEGYKRCKPGDLVINTMWAWMGALGIAPMEGILSPAYGVYRLDQSQMVPEYYGLLYRSPAYVAEMTRYSRGVWWSRQRLYPDAFLSLKTLLPPLDEQRTIVAAFQATEDSMKELDSKLDCSLALLNERRQALITAAVTGELDPSSYRRPQELEAA